LEIDSKTALSLLEMPVGVFTYEAEDFYDKELCDYLAYVNTKHKASEPSYTLDDIYEEVNNISGEDALVVIKYLNFFEDGNGKRKDSKFLKLSKMLIEHNEDIFWHKDLLDAIARGK
jgi:hypothetical protein